MGLEEETPLGAGQDKKALVSFHLEIQCFLKYNVLHLKCGLNMYIISYFTGQVTKFLGSQNSVSVNFPLGTGHADQALPNQHKVKTLARDTLHFISRGKP